MEWEVWPTVFSLRVWERAAKYEAQNNGQDVTQMEQEQDRTDPVPLVLE